MANKTLALSAKNVHKFYGKVHALRGASLDLRQGEILGLLGPNGAGKTTFIKILATLLSKDSGRVIIEGHDLDNDPQAIRHLFGYVGQDTERSAYARLTIKENLHFFGTLRGMPRTLIDAQIDKLSHYFDFHGQLDKQFTRLSGGQKQTVVIMRALMHNPPLIYLDEPTKGLDPIIAIRIRRFLKHYVQQENKSLLLTSHVLSEVDELADRVALIHQGTIPTVGTSASLKAAVGAKDAIEIERAALPDRTRAKIEALPQVLFTLDHDANWLSFGVEDALDGAEAIIRTIREDHVTPGFRHHTISLEDAFIHHIGELGEQFEQ